MLQVEDPFQDRFRSSNYLTPSFDESLPEKTTNEDFQLTHLGVRTNHAVRCISCLEALRSFWISFRVNFEWATK